jgi:tetratricopeptide (TPR) repeat protein
VGLLLVAGASAAAWWWTHRPPPATAVPAAPEFITDPEVVQAITRAREKVAEKPGDGRTWGSLGMVFLAHALPNEADVCFAEAARLDPGSPKWPYGRGVLLFDRDPVPFLQRAADLADALPDYRAPVRLRLAEALLERQRLDEAERLFRDVFQRAVGTGEKGPAHDAHMRAALGLGMIALARGEEAEADDYLKLVRDSHSPFATRKTTVQLAILARVRGADKTAEDYERKAATLPNDASWPDPFFDEVMQLLVGRHARSKRAEDMEKMGDFAGAAELNRQSIERDPSALAYTAAGINFLRMGQPDQALKYLREGTRRFPDSPSVHFGLAQVQMTRGSIAAQQSPGSSQSRDAFRDAAQEARRAAELRPMFSSAYVLWGQALMNLDKPDEAVVPFRQAVEVAPEKIDLHLALGEAHMQAGQYAEAENCFLDAQKINPNDQRPSQALNLLRTSWWQRAFQKVR